MINSLSDLAFSHASSNHLASMAKEILKIRQSFKSELPSLPTSPFLNLIDISEDFLHFEFFDFYVKETGFSDFNDIPDELQFVIDVTKTEPIIVDIVGDLNIVKIHKSLFTLSKSNLIAILEKSAKIKSDFEKSLALKAEISRLESELSTLKSKQI